MSEENNKPDEELENEEPDNEEESDESEDQNTEEDSNVAGAALAGLAGAAALAGAKGKGKKSTKGAAKPTKGKATKTAAPAKPKPAMPPGTVDINAKVDEIQKLTDKNTVWTVAGYSFTPAKLMVLGTILSGALGGLYGSFEVYKDYMDMKKKIATYVAPDLSEFDKRLEVITQKADNAQEYTNQIKNDLKTDIRRLEGVVDGVERSAKQSQRDAEVSVREVQQELRRNSKEIDQSVKQIQRDVDSKIQQTQREVDSKIQKALDNPLSK